MIDLFLRAADRNAMLAGLRAAGFTAEVPADDAPDDALAVTTEEGDPPAEVTRYYVPVTASHAHSLVMPVTVVVTPAVIAADGTVVDPAVLDARYHATLRLLSGGSLLTVAQALSGAGVEIIDPAGQAVSFAGDAPSMDALRAAARQKLAGIFRAKRDAGIVIGGKAVATTPDAVQELSELVARLTRTGGTQDFVTRSGAVFKGVDLDAATAIYHAVTDRYAVLMAAEVPHAEAIAGAGTPEALAIVEANLTTGWGA